MCNEEILTPVCDVKESDCSCDCNVVYGTCDCKTCSDDCVTTKDTAYYSGPEAKCADRAYYSSDNTTSPSSNETAMFNKCLSLSEHYLMLYHAIKDEQNIETRKLAKSCIEEAMTWADTAGEAIVEESMANWYGAENN